MQRALFLLVACLPGLCAQTQQLRSFAMYGDVRITVDVPSNYNSRTPTRIIIYALPNGNTTGQTMGKKINPGDQWQYDIQHIKAQTAFIRNALPKESFVVAYLENDQKSWPAWKTKHPQSIAEVQHIVDTLYNLFPSKHSALCLNGHSGGGRFIFSSLDGLKQLPFYVERITFLDSDYGYDPSYLPLLAGWLKENKKAALNVFAYHDNIALLNGKTFVSDTGGTWYRSHLMLKDLSQHFRFEKIREDSLIIHASADKRIWFFFRTNPEKKIYHTVQVELNGFIHSILLGTRKESKGYTYFGERAYTQFIESGK